MRTASKIVNFICWPVRLLAAVIGTFFLVVVFGESWDKMMEFNREWMKGIEGDL